MEEEEEDGEEDDGEKGDDEKEEAERMVEDQSNKSVYGDDF